MSARLLPWIVCLVAVAGCCCKPSGGKRVPGPSVFGDTPCEPRAEAGYFGSTVHLELPPEPETPADGYQWYKLNGAAFEPLIPSDRIQGVTSANLAINRFQIGDVAYYGRQKVQGTALGTSQFPCDQVYNLMGLTNGTGGVLTVWGSPVVYTGSTTNSTCGGLPCPGTYSRYVSYSRGWVPINGLSPIQAKDGSSLTQVSTKIRYYCAPPATPPTCGCGGSVTVLNPSASKLYTFTLYFPPGTTPQIPHPLNLINFNP